MKKLTTAVRWLLALVSFSVDLRWRDLHAGFHVVDYDPYRMKSFWYRLYFAKLARPTHKLEREITGWPLDRVAE